MYNNNDKRVYTPIYRNEVQYELNNLIFEYHDLRRRVSFGDVDYVDFRKRADEIKKESRLLVEDEQSVESIADYSLEQRMIDQEVLQSLLWESTEVSMDDLEDCLQGLEDLLMDEEIL